MEGSTAEEKMLGPGVTRWRSFRSEDEWDFEEIADLSSGEEEEEVDFEENHASDAINNSQERIDQPPIEKSELTEEGMFNYQSFTILKKN